ncbi:MAG TPA: hypothetical protein VFO29_09795 [Candidatus Rubrimentiphilum sp.]|nr:hypothetical protein [Candidatus Rubrimentiphilum sp.]
MSSPNDIFSVFAPAINVQNGESGRAVAISANRDAIVTDTEL